MLFIVKGLFGYIAGGIGVIFTGILIHMWIHWSIQSYEPKQSLFNRKPTRRGRYY